MNQTKIKFIFFLILIIFLGCTTVKTPYNFLPLAEEKLTDTFGAWIIAEQKTETSKKIFIKGELIAVTEDDIIILSFGPVIVPIDTIDAVTIALYKNNGLLIGSWTLLGALSTLSHGLGLIITAPLWLVTGSITGIIDSGDGIIKVTEDIESFLKQMAIYARFPQGLPPDLDLRALTFKNW